ncbi:hypothetical protein PIS_074 [Saccharomonospora phage PIS 136]|nr:hypothetical protein PIS_074 [Saccharomonospora phage PIS 136]
MRKAPTSYGRGLSVVVMNPGGDYLGVADSGAFRAGSGISRRVSSTAPSSRRIATSSPIVAGSRPARAWNSSGASVNARNASSNTWSWSDGTSPIRVFSVAVISQWAPSPGTLAVMWMVGCSFGVSVVYQASSSML